MLTLWTAVGVSARAWRGVGGRVSSHRAGLPLPHALVSPFLLAIQGAPVERSGNSQARARLLFI